MKKIIVYMLLALLFAGNASISYGAQKAKLNLDKPLVTVNDSGTKSGQITPKTIGAGALSLLIWPGIGQAVNNDRSEKVATHAVLGLIPVYRFWSGYDALVNRQGGYWQGRI